MMLSHVLPQNNSLIVSPCLFHSMSSRCNRTEKCKTNLRAVFPRRRFSKVAADSTLDEKRKCTSQKLVVATHIPFFARPKCIMWAVSLPKVTVISSSCDSVVAANKKLWKGEKCRSEVSSRFPYSKCILLVCSTRWVVDPMYSVT